MTRTRHAFLPGCKWEKPHGGWVPFPFMRTWDNPPAHRGRKIRELLRRPGLNLRLVDP